jgi:hypothetical protein
LRESPGREVGAFHAEARLNTALSHFLYLQMHAFAGTVCGASE